MLLLNLVAGAMVDRLPRRRVRIVAALASGAIVATMPVASLLGVLRLEHLYVATFLAGCGTVFSRLAVGAMLPQLVGKQNLLEANGKMLTRFSLALVLGPSLTGLLAQVMRPPAALGVHAASYLICAAFRDGPDTCVRAVWRSRQRGGAGGRWRTAAGRRTDDRVVLFRIWVHRPAVGRQREQLASGSDARAPARARLGCIDVRRCWHGANRRAAGGLGWPGRRHPTVAPRIHRRDADPVARSV